MNPLPAVFEWGAKVGDSSPPSYTLHFSERFTIWRYLFVASFVTQLPSLCINPVKIGDKLVNFQVLPEKVTLPGGREAVAIVSDEPIPLRKAPPWKIVLSGAPPIEGTRLPLAGKNLTLTPNSQGKKCSVLSKSGFNFSSKSGFLYGLVD